VKVLAVGAHPDDIELGCGGTLLKHAQAGHEIVLLVMTGGERGPRHDRTREREQEDAAAMMNARVVWGGFVDTMIPSTTAAVDVVEQVLAEFDPDVVYTHATTDTHQDHRATSEAVLSATRRCRRVLFFESPTTVGFQPHVYIDVAKQVTGKGDVLRAHLSQVLKNGLVDLEANEALARYRGFQGRMRYAEAFQVHRLQLEPAALGLDEPSTIDLRGQADVPGQADLPAEMVKPMQAEPEV
jgi:LmbE family N-acetylglucosaminyl deacetylase